MNEGLLVYLWVLYGNLSVIIVIALVFSLVFYGISIFITMAAGMFSTISANSIEEATENVENYYKQDAVEFYKFWAVAKKYIKVPIVLMIIVVLFPTRNEAIVIFSAPAIVDIARDGWNSDATKRIGNILDNSIGYLEEKAEELNKKEND